MAIDYSSILTNDQKLKILEQRLVQFGSEAYQHSINKEVAIATANIEGIKAAEDAIDVLEKAIEIHQAEIDKLSKE